MKYLLLIALVCTAGCKKSETQYKDADDKKSTVNDRKSDTIKTLPDVSNSTATDSADVKSNPTDY